MSMKSLIAGPLVGTYGLVGSATGFGRLSRLRELIGESPQFFSMNLRMETWSA
jgi:hypothetical protein